MNPTDPNYERFRQSLEGVLERPEWIKQALCWAKSCADASKRVITYDYLGPLPMNTCSGPNASDLNFSLSEDEGEVMQEALQEQEEERKEEEEG